LVVLLPLPLLLLRLCSADSLAPEVRLPLPLHPPPPPLHPRLLRRLSLAAQLVLEQLRLEQLRHSVSQCQHLPLQQLLAVLPRA